MLSEKAVKIQVELAGLVYESLGEESAWDLAVYSARLLRSFGEDDCSLYSEGRFMKWVRTPGEVADLAVELREEMSSEHGAWYSVSLSMSADGSYSYSFNYDQDPDWDLRPSLEMYADDLAHNPRPSDEIPDWYPVAHDLVRSELMDDLEYAVAMLVFDISKDAPEWDKATLTVGVDGPKNRAEVSCDRGLTTHAKMRVSDDRFGPIERLRNQVVSDGREWRGMTLWLESNGEYMISYD
ncbi:MAG: hypothetical protein QM658_06300 [Gordonia sp. (in: high G+C Gram-positive bacteria)]